MISDAIKASSEMIDNFNALRGEPSTSALLLIVTVGLALHEGLQLGLMIGNATGDDIERYEPHTQKYLRDNILRVIEGVGSILYTTGMPSKDFNELVMLATRITNKALQGINDEPASQ